jgi:hypothetical protein
MTLLVALRGADGIVFGCRQPRDLRRSKPDDSPNDSQQKAHILSAHAAVLTAGAGEVGAMLLQQAKALVDSGSLDGVTLVMEKLRETCRAKFGEWFPSVPAIQAPARRGV